MTPPTKFSFGLLLIWPKG